MKGKVDKGTRPDRHVCDGCYHYGKVEGETESSDRRFCRALASDGGPVFTITGKVTSCNMRHEVMPNDQVNGYKAWSVFHIGGGAYVIPPERMRDWREYIEERKQGKIEVKATEPALEEILH
jgi:hypothetical protein